MQVEAKAYTSGSLGIYKWKLEHIRVDATVYTSGSEGIYKGKEAKVY
jgi:hypothetical protein